MSNSNRNSTEHIKLFIPGPVEVRPEILDAQAGWMIGHRMPECVDLLARVDEKIKQVFFTDNRVFVIAGTGTGFWEGASRNCVRQRVLHGVNGAFSQRWAEVSAANGKEVTVLEAEWGEPILPDAVAAAVADGDFDAVAVVHNETSTGITSPVADIARAVRALPGGDDIIVMVDSVSGASGIELRLDEWDIDVLVTASQKAFALPPGLAICAVSERAMARAATVTNRGYYFDFLTLDKYYQRHQTPSTTPVSLVAALDVQLDAMLAEGIENRFARHIAMRDRTIEYITGKGFALYGNRAYASPTVTNVANNLNVDIGAMNAFLRTRGMILSNGYGKRLKNKAFRIAHMGDIMPADLEALFAALDTFLA